MVPAVVVVVAFYLACPMLAPRIRAVRGARVATLATGVSPGADDEVVKSN